MTRRVINGTPYCPRGNYKVPIIDISKFTSNTEIFKMTFTVEVLKRNASISFRGNLFPKKKQLKFIVF